MSKRILMQYKRYNIYIYVHFFSRHPINRDQVKRNVNLMERRKEKTVY